MNIQKEAMYDSNATTTIQYSVDKKYNKKKKKKFKILSIPQVMNIVCVVNHGVQKTLVYSQSNI